MNTPDYENNCLTLLKKLTCGYKLYKHNLKPSFIILGLAWFVFGFV